METLDHGQPSSAETEAGDHTVGKETQRPVARSAPLADAPATASWPGLVLAAVLALAPIGCSQRAQSMPVAPSGGAGLASGGAGVGAAGTAQAGTAQAGMTSGGLGGQNAGAGPGAAGGVGAGRPGSAGIAGNGSPVTGGMGGVGPDPCTPVGIPEIEARYHSWLVGDGDFSPPFVRTRYQALLEYFAKAHQNLQGVDLSNASPLDPASAQAELKPVFQNILYPLALSHALKGPVDNPNPDHASPQALTALENSLLRVFDYLHRRGFSRSVDTGIKGYDTFLQTGELHLGGSLGIRTAGYAFAVFLLRDLLARRNKLMRELNTLNHITRLPADPLVMKFQGFNADGVRALLNNRLLYLLALPAAQSAQAQAGLTNLKAFVDRSLAIAPGWSDLIKPDYVGYHHRGVYGNAYAPNASHVAALMASFLRCSEYALAPASLDNLAHALRTLELYYFQYSIAPNLRGRFPNNHDGIVNHLPAFAYMAETLGPRSPHWPRLAAAVQSRWNSNLQAPLDRLVRSVHAGISITGGLGAWRALEHTLATPSPAPPALGNWVKPYAGAVIHRQASWTAVAKGYSKYIWDYEASKSDNLYGRYLGTGSLFVTAQPDYNHFAPGWDWNRVPGTTVVNYPITDLPPFDRAFSREIVVGGANTGPGSLAAVFAMKVGEQNHPGRLSAHKSVFFFGNQIVALGSGITKRQATNHAVETTLFQTAIPTSGAGRLPLIDGAPARPSARAVKLGNGPGWLSDGQGNAYYLPDRNKLRFRWSKQESRTENGKHVSSGDVAVAWIAHGNAPQSDGYEYVLLPQHDPAQAGAFVANPGAHYRVLRRDQVAHSVWHGPLTGDSRTVVSYVVFDPRQFDGAASEGSLISVDQPALIVTDEKADGSLVVGASVPDLGLLAPHEFLQHSGKVTSPEHLYRNSRVFQLTLTLKGNWKNLDGSATVVGQAPGSTTLQVACRHGLPARFRLVP